MANGLKTYTTLMLCKSEIGHKIASRTIAFALNLSPIYFTVSWTLPGLQLF